MLKVDVEKISGVKKSLRIEVPQEVVKEAFESVYSALKKKVKLPGFRQGRVPVAVLEQRFSHEAEHDVVERLIPDYYQKALKESGILPVVLPTIEKVEIKRNAPLSFTATVETKPEFLLSNYSNLSLTRKEVTVSNESIEEALKGLQESHSQLEACDSSQEVEVDHFVIIDFEGKIAGQVFEGGQGKGMLIQIGSKTLVPGFEDQLVGRKKGDEVQVKVEFPEDYHAKNLAGKAAEFHVIIREVKIKIISSIDDAFAKDVGDYANLEELKNALEKDLRARAERDVENDLRNQCIQKLIEKNPIEVPPTLVDNELSSMLFRLQEQLKVQGRTLDSDDTQLSSLRDQYTIVARERVQGRLILQEIARKEGMEISNTEIDEELEKMAKETQREVAEIQKYMRSNEGAKENLGERLLEDKALSLVLSGTTSSGS